MELGEKFARLKESCPGTEFTLDCDKNLIYILEPSRGYAKSYIVTLDELDMTAMEWVDHELNKLPSSPKGGKWFEGRDSEKLAYITTLAPVAVGRSLDRGRNITVIPKGQEIERKESSKYQIICAYCGTVPLTKPQYERQLFRINVPWYCPSCGIEANFDDETYDKYLENEAR